MIETKFEELKRGKYYKVIYTADDNLKDESYIVKIGKCFDSYICFNCISLKEPSFETFSSTRAGRMFYYIGNKKDVEYLLFSELL